VRASSALSVAGPLPLAGSAATDSGPHGMDKALRGFPTLVYAESVAEAHSVAELVTLATEWQEFRDLDPKAVAELVARTLIIDGRNVLDVASWNAAGWTVEALGRTLTP